MNYNNNMIILKTEPNLPGIISNLGTSYSGFDQSLYELVDNAISNLRANADTPNPMLVRVTVEEQGKMIGITVEDSGSGISDLEDAFRIAGMAHQQTPLNEHGQGLKQALAYTVKRGGGWSLYTRGPLEREMGVCWAVVPPNNQLDGIMKVEERTDWPGELGSTGTIIRLQCPYELFASLVPGVSEKSPFERLVEILVEGLRYTYSGIIRTDNASIEVVAIPASGKVQRRILKPLDPNWTDEFTDITPTTIDLGGGPVVVSGRYGLVKAAQDAVLHYQANQATSGAYISLNGRLIAGHLLGEIWHRTRHPSGNSFVLYLDVRSDNLAALPETAVEKNAFRQGDPRLKALYRWIRTIVAILSTKEKLEIRLFKKLEKQFSKDSAYSRITREMFVFTSIGMKDRLDLFTCTHSGVCTAYEGKAKQSKTNDVYQLRKYWDGCIHDGIAITDGVLVAAKHNDDVRALVAYINTQSGEDGRLYHFRLETWAALGIDISAA